MSEHESQEPEQEQGDALGGTAVRALAAAAVTGAATYAVRRALSARKDDDERDEEETDDTPVEADDEEDEDVEDEPSSELSRRTGSAGSKLRGVSSSALSSAGPALVPLVEEAAGSAGRYVAEHAPEIVREHVIPQFIEAFEKAS